MSYFYTAVICRIGSAIILKLLFRTYTVYSTTQYLLIYRALLNQPVLELDFRAIFRRIYIEN
jgi:hypothetical protein